MSDGQMSERLGLVQDRIRTACRAAGRPPNSVQLMAVTKGHPRESVVELAKLGVRLFGENRVQEAREKYADLETLLPGEICLHLIGHLQTNKVKLALATFQIIQSLDSERLAEHLERSATSDIGVMVEVNTAREGQKHGLHPEDVARFLAGLGRWPSLRVVGLLAMLPVSAEGRSVEHYMEEARRLWESLRRERWPWAPLTDLSMGMSGDFETAIRHGSTLVRVGTALLGPRQDRIKE